MISTLEKSLVVKEGRLCLVPKEYPNWYGIPDIGFIYHNDWADPELEYDGEILNSHIVEDSMWSIYTEDCEETEKKPSTDEFEIYMKKHADDVYYLIELALGRIEV